MRPSISMIAEHSPLLDDLRLDYPLDAMQGPFGALPTIELWMYGMFWSSSVITGFVPFDITPRHIP